VEVRQKKGQEKLPKSCSTPRRNGELKHPGIDRSCLGDLEYIRRQKARVHWSDYRQARESFVGVPSHSRPHHYIVNSSRVGIASTSSSLLAMHRGFSNAG
jgi:hypothetical protein